MSSDAIKIIEENKRFSKSAIWKMQRDYFDKEGINAWVSQVPFYITSNPFIAQGYAKLVFGFICDWTKKNPKASQHPFYIMELGTGSGRFSYYFVKALDELLQAWRMEGIKICYIMSDFTSNNIGYWEDHPALKSYVDRGLIDFALYDMEVEKPIKLIKCNKDLSPELLVNPLTVLANYIFDTITQDAFAVKEGSLFELLLSLSTKNDKEASHMEDLATNYSLNKINKAYYEDEILNSILKDYQKNLKQSSFLFPIGSFNAIKFLKKLSHDKLLIIATDKGYNTIESLDNLGPPAILFQGSFSLMVNFHALAQYFKNTGGDAALQQSRKGIKTSVFSSGFKLKDMPTMTKAIEEHVHGFSPGDYFVVHTRMSESFQECSVSTLAAYMQIALWDPHMYLKLANYIVSKLDNEDEETINFLSSNMEKMAKNYYFLPQSPCILFEVGVFYHAIKKYQEAANYYLKAEPFLGEQFSFYYNLALCQHHLDQNTLALKNFKKSLTLDPSSQEAEQWIRYLENQN